MNLRSSTAKRKFENNEIKKYIEKLQYGNSSVENDRSKSVRKSFSEKQNFPNKNNKPIESSDYQCVKEKLKFMEQEAARREEKLKLIDGNNDFEEANNLNEIIVDSIKAKIDLVDRCLTE